jgi:hypothetical protein
VFGIVLTKAKRISWFRIQEMFRFQGFHMFGIFATALPTAIIGVQLLKRRWRRTLGGQAIVDSAEASRLGECATPWEARSSGSAGRSPARVRAAVRTARQRRHDDGRRHRERDARTWTYGRARHRCRTDHSHRHSSQHAEQVWADVDEFFTTNLLPADDVLRATLETNVAEHCRRSP